MLSPKAGPVIKANSESDAKRIIDGFRTAVAQAEQDLSARKTALQEAEDDLLPRFPNLLAESFQDILDFDSYTKSVFDNVDQRLKHAMESSRAFENTYYHLVVDKISTKLDYDKFYSEMYNFLYPEKGLNMVITREDLKKIKAKIVGRKGFSISDWAKAQAISYAIGLFEGCRVDAGQEVDFIMKEYNEKVKLIEDFWAKV